MRFHLTFRSIKIYGLTAATLSLCLMPVSASAAAAQTSTEQQAFARAATEFGVPENVLLALAYNESRWESNGNQMSVDGGYGVMDLRTYTPTITSGRDGSQVNVPKKGSAYYTLDQAAAMLHVPASTLETNEQQNVRGAAAVLAADAKQLNDGKLSDNPADWYGAVAEFGGAADAQAASSFADDVYATITGGVSLTTSAGQAMSLPPLHGLQPNKATANALNLPAQNAGQNRLPGQNAECPRTLNCRFIPAAYAQDDPNDPTNYGNYDPAHRPADMQIKYIYIHDTEGSYDSSISHFQDPNSYVSANYVIRSSDGAITQMVPNEDVSWGVGNWYMNMHGINIEHEGFAAQGATWYTEAMYESSATLVRWLAAKYHIPLDRQHIIAHGDTPRYPAANQAVQHWDPGPYWDWNHYMDLVQGKSDASATAGTASALAPRPGQVVTISPNFATNVQPVQNCEVTPCVPESQQGSSIVYLRTAPNTNAPLITDKYMHPDGSPGTTNIEDWSATATTGFQYVVAAVQGNWTGIWYAGQVAWFYNPAGPHRTAVPSSSDVVAPLPGRSFVPVYPAAYPESAAYPSVIPVQINNAVYTIPAGQSYTTTGDPTQPTDYFYDATINYSKPDDHLIVHGSDRYYQISYNHHIGFVKASDVVLLPHP